MVAIDRDELVARQRTLRMIWIAYAISPLLLAVVGGMVCFPGDGSSGPGSGSVDAVASRIYLAVTLTPLGGVAFARGFRRRVPARIASNTASSVTLGGLLTTATMLEMAFWETITLLTFGWVMLGLSFAYLLGAVVATSVGNALCYPRLSDWMTTADEAEEIARHGTIDREGLPS